MLTAIALKFVVKVVAEAFVVVLLKTVLEPLAKSFWEYAAKRVSLRKLYRALLE